MQVVRSCRLLKEGLFRDASEPQDHVPSGKHIRLETVENHVCPLVRSSRNSLKFPYSLRGKSKEPSILFAGQEAVAPDLLSKMFACSGLRRKISCRWM